jgi:hypothetical protein
VLADRANVYLTINGPVDPNLVPSGGGVQPNLGAGKGLRALLVDGPLFTFNRGTGKLHWYHEFHSDMLVLNHFDEMPILLFASRYTRFVGVPPDRREVKVFPTRALNKRSGKLVYDSDTLPLEGVFHTLLLNRARQRIDFLGTTRNVYFELKP